MTEKVTETTSDQDAPNTDELASTEEQQGFFSSLGSKAEAALDEHPILSGITLGVASHVVYDKGGDLAAKGYRKVKGLFRGASASTAAAATEEGARGLFGGAIKSLF